MPGTSYSYLDLTVLPELRRKVLSGDAAILFSSDMLGLSWANAAGALLFGGAGIAEMIASPLNANQPFVQQLSAAARQIEGDEPIIRGFRIARGLRTELIQCELSKLTLPGGDDAILLTCRDEKLAKPMREHELAENAVESLSGFADAAAILDDYGLPLAATSSFADLEIDPGELAALVKEAGNESDRLIKRAQAMADGSMLGIGIARISDRPGRYLVVCASGSNSESEYGESEEADNRHRDNEDGDSRHGELAEAASPAMPVTMQDARPELDDGRGETGWDGELAEAQDYVPEDAGMDAPEDYQEELHFHSAGTDNADLPPEGGWEHEEPAQDFNSFRDEDALVDEDDVADLGRLDGEPGSDSFLATADADGAAVSSDDDTEAEEAHADDTAPSTPVSSSILERWYYGTPLEDGRKAAPEPVSATGDSGSGEDAESDLDDAVNTTRQAATGEADIPGNDANQDTGHNQDDSQFVFSADGQPVRFAWIIDSDQVFRSVSPELAQTVGPNAADIVGRRWADVARVFGFDHGGEIGRLLEKRDTWSGKSIFWPVQGTDLAVPIDLAALPAFDSNRRFDGFRGFGIIRTSDAIVDPDETGRALDKEIPVLTDPGHSRNVVPISRDEDQEIEARSWSAPAGEEAYFDWGDDAKDASNHDEEGRDEESRDDVSEPEQSDEGVAVPGWSEQESRSNVVELTSRLRNDAGDALNRRESQAFSEIGRKLREDEQVREETPFNDQANGKDLASADAASSEPDAPDQHREASGTANDRPDDQDVVHLNGQAADDRMEAGSDNDLGDDPESPYAAPVDGGDDGDGAGEVDTSILEQLPAPVLVYRNGATLFVNSELLKLTGYSDRDEFAQAGGVDAILSGSDSNHDAGHGTTLICKDGSSLPINPLLQTVPWDGGKALLLTFRPSGAERQDAVSERAALDIARVSELQNILDTATDGIIVMDSDGAVESFNASAEALFGTDFDQAKGRNLTDFFAQESHKTIHDYISEITQPGVAGILNDGREVIGKEANGGLIPLFITIGRMGSDDKLCLVLRDMTQWKKAEEELVGARRSAELASEQKSDFLARVSHEIRTPLNAIIGFSDIMIEERFGPVGNERYREYLRDINRSGVHVLDLINDLLDISKIEAGKMDLTYEAVDLNQIASETVALLQPQANRERIIIRTSLSRAVPRVVADARSIRQIILNLVSNAIKFTPMNGQVIVSTVYEGNGEVALRVRDTGRGMSEKEIESAMKPFQQIGAVEEKRGQGTGLGLPLTKALVEANRAYFDIESKPGEGTIAHVHFPIQRVLAD